MNDNSKGTLTNTTTTGDQMATDNAAPAWEPTEGDALNSMLFSTEHFGRQGVRLTALAAPVTFLAAENTTEGPGEILGKVFGGIIDLGGTLFVQQPLLTSAMSLALVGAAYLKLRGDIDFTRDDGFASKHKLRKAMGSAQLVKRRKVLRPSLADVPSRKVPVNAVGVYVGRDRRTGLHLYMAIEDSSLMLAPMGAGKTAKLSNWIIDAEGAVLATSTKFDIVEWTERMRARVGRILLWNPQGIAGRDSNIAWDPVIGCADPEEGVERSMRRARYLLEGSDATKGVENRTFWLTASYSVLKAFLWAADADGRSLLDVARWSKNVRNFEAIEIFEKYAQPDPANPTRPVAPRGWKDDLVQAQKVEGKPTTSENVFGTLAKTFMFLDSPRVQKIVEAAHHASTPQFDIAAYLNSRDTLYLLGREDGMGSLGPLFTALTGEIYETARALAPMNRGGRLDPPWSMVLDEAALICSVPLPLWTADSRGLGINVHAVFQSPAQIYERWGKYGYQTIWDNCTKLILGGLSNDEHLDSLSKLCGKHMEKRESRSTSPTGQNGTMRESVSHTKVEVDTMTASDIMNLEPGEILVLRKHLGGPVVAKFTAVWDRKDIKSAEKSDKQAAKAELKARKRKLAAATSAAPHTPAAATGPTNPRVTPTEDPWAPQPQGPWAQPTMDTNPWTAAPAASGWATDGVRGPRTVLGEVVPPAEPPVVPEKPAHAPTGHLEQVPPQPEPSARPADAQQPIPLRKTGTDNAAIDDDDDMGAF
ncbi:type IV secretory system conjugative DNA transfer family protein [Streptomyces natalensis]|uniref:type IV secretory system conjugative DNA transfer family protein n=1 Tax=Streptomyces natalensis TaxID=68242 RepID=UPI000690FECD|nr:type IV secretory system conjugative DNA transfer family protein [Streptomyces natalensis]